MTVFVVMLLVIIAFAVVAVLAALRNNRLNEREKALQFEFRKFSNPPPKGFRIGDAVSVQAYPDEPESWTSVAIVVVQDYSFVEIDGVPNWILHTSDGKSWLHTNVMRVPGGVPGKENAQGENVVGSAST